MDIGPKFEASVLQKDVAPEEDPSDETLERVWDALEYLETHKFDEELRQLFGELT